MDPEETMRALRDAMIEISDLVGMRLQQGGSQLTVDQLEEARDAGERVVNHSESLIDWFSKGGFKPNQG